jgi:hypothetical protein
LFNRKSKRMLIPVVVSFVFYFTWTWWVNAMVSDDLAIVLRSALLQGSYSALMTAIFTSMLNLSLAKMKCHKYIYLALLPPLAIQSSMVFLINVINQTPNLSATIAPSILFSAIYGIVYLIGLSKTVDYQCKS